MGWRNPKQSSSLIPLSPASQYCFVQPFATCFSKYQHCWDDGDIHHHVQQGQELTCFEPTSADADTLPRQKQRRVWPTSLSSSFTPKPRCRVKKSTTSADRSARREAHGFRLPSGQPGYCCCCGRDPWVFEGRCYLPAASVSTPNTGDRQVPALGVLCSAYGHLLPPRLSLVGVNSWCVLLPRAGVTRFRPYRWDTLSPLCLVWNRGAWKSRSILQQSQSCAARTLLHEAKDRQTSRNGLR